MNVSFPRIWCVSLSLLLAAATTIAQTPKPKPKAPAKGGASSSKATTTSAKPPYDGPATLLFQVDMGSRIWIDGVLALTAKAGDVKPINISLGEHLVKVESVEGSTSWQRTVKVERAEQMILGTNLVSLRAQEDAARAKAAADAEAARAAAAEDAEVKRRTAQDDAAKAEAERRENLEIDQALTALRSTTDSADRLRKLVALEKAHSDDARVSEARRLAAQAVAVELPGVIASFLKSLGTVELEPKEMAVKNTIAYTAEASTCSLSVQIDERDYWNDGDYFQELSSATINFSALSGVYDERSDDNEGLDLSVADGSRVHTQFRPGKKEPRILEQRTDNETFVHVMFPPRLHSDIVHLREQFETLISACTLRDK
jgi:hypothetical protein